MSEFPTLEATGSGDEQAWPKYTEKEGRTDQWP